jgi:hypothetical protein
MCCRFREPKALDEKSFFVEESVPGADPVVLLTDALNLALVGVSGGILPREILKSRTSEMRFPAF